MTQDPKLCGQEGRLAGMEMLLKGINDNLVELKDLMVNMTKARERIATLQQGHNDQEQRLRKLEQAQAAGKWMERVVWLVVSTGLIGFFKFFGGTGGGGGK